MFAELSSTRKSIGDVDVLYHDGLYHLFHLVLPNHDYIAHAISDNGLNWRRVDNAVFIGDPGSWDDLMLWTMHVSPDPDTSGRWRMFYTGISRRDKGGVQRVGLATSDDLYHWKKYEVDWKDTRGKSDPERVKQARAKLDQSISDRIRARQSDHSCFPLQADGSYYESKTGTARNWISFRDPFYYHDSDRRWLLTAARVDSGPILRRGCVGLMEEVSPNHFEARPPLHAPMQYDDIEVPNLFREEGDYYLIGSLREDAKIRYWQTSKLHDPWRNFADNVLLPKGNYAGRICRDRDGLLLWNFYNTNIHERTANNIMPPPKRMSRSADGQLQLSTFEGIKQRKTGIIDTKCLRSIMESKPTDICRIADDTLTIGSEAGYQLFAFSEEVNCFTLNCRIEMQSVGKCGFVSRLDPDSHDGYFVSLDLVKGIASFRSWKTRCDKSGDDMMQFYDLQSGYWQVTQNHSVNLQLLSFGSYHELSLNGRIILSLVDSTFSSGLLGFYVETATLRIDDLVVENLKSPTQSDDHLTDGP